MNCKSAEMLLGPYLDGELTDVERIVELEEHLESCTGCAEKLTTLREVRNAVREKAPYFEASNELRRKIAAQTVRKPNLWIRYSFSLGSVAAMVAALVLINARTGDAFAAELVGDHVRSLQAAHLFDVASSNRHTVKPWFQGKIDFSPAVPDLTAEGFPLLGGRLDYVRSKPAAALVYGRAKHVINVFVMRSSAGSERSASDRDGFHLVRWRVGDLDYWAVSDVSLADLQQFEQRFVAASRG